MGDAKYRVPRREVRTGPVGVRFIGWDKTWERVRNLRKTAPEAVIMGIMKLGEKIMADAVRRVPVDTGRLRSSGYVAPPSRLSTTNTVEIGFGTEYAIPVHERTEVRHETGEAKYLERAIAASASRAVWQVAEEAERHIEKGGQPTASEFPQSPRS